MRVAKGTEAGDSRPDVGESLGMGMRVGKTEGRSCRGRPGPDHAVETMGNAGRFEGN